MAEREESHAPIVVVGRHRSWPTEYLGLTRILAELSGSRVSVVPITPLDWVLGRIRGYGQLVFEVASAVDKALLENGSDKVVLVGHSTGGILARVYVGGDPPYGGGRPPGHRRVSPFIFLGTPPNAPRKKKFAPPAQGDK